jgi:hypothetical protein
VIGRIRIAQESDGLEKQLSPFADGRPRTLMKFLEGSWEDYPWDQGATGWEFDSVYLDPSELERWVGCYWHSCLDDYGDLSIKKIVRTTLFQHRKPGVWVVVYSWLDEDESGDAKWFREIDAAEARQFCDSVEISKPPRLLDELDAIELPSILDQSSSKDKDQSTSEVGSDTPPTLEDRLAEFADMKWAIGTEKHILAKAVSGGTTDYASILEILAPNVDRSSQTKRFTAVAAALNRDLEASEFVMHLAKNGANHVALFTGPKSQKKKKRSKRKT